MVLHLAYWMTGWDFCIKRRMERHFKTNTSSCMNLLFYLLKWVLTFQLNIDGEPQGRF